MQNQLTRIFLGSGLALLLVLAGCDTSGPQVAPSDEEAPSTPNVISGQYIVVLSGTPSKSATDVRSVATSLLGKSGQLGAVYSNALDGFVARGLSDAQVEQIESDPRVDYVEKDRVVQLAPPDGKGPGGDDGGSTGQVTPYGTTRVGGPADGTGLTAWVIDSGVDLDHPDLNVDASRSATFFAKGKDSKSADDGNGHGSHVAGTIGALNNDIGTVGVAAGATIVGVKVLDSRGSGSYSVVIDGVDYVAANASAGDVANLSLGGPTSDALDTAVKNLADQGVLVALAAGNSGEDANLSSPSRVEYPGVYTVSAMDDTDSFASFSNFGNPPIEFASPGVDVESTYKDGGYATLSGTSMASPHLAGILLITGANPPTDGTVNNDPDGDADPIATL
ncbi:peptidase S8 [Longibacter salinarum]|uniref:Peptidase S8 n=1 Tax=Longibacter salinarum TaxID=1850348 RepID=A0A2A8CUH2_9BACT|nr:S8 family peptidase [Longibacter salinarum]PEN11400.1 peptidase S8 [Longibacter salinarum]